MISYLVEGLLNNTTSLLLEGFSINVLNIKLFIYLSNFNINTLTAISYFSLTTKTKLANINVNNKYTKLIILSNNRLVNYKISNYSYLNKINVN